MDDDKKGLRSRSKKYRKRRKTLHDVASCSAIDDLFNSSAVISENNEDFEAFINTDVAEIQMKQNVRFEEDVQIEEINLEFEEDEIVNGIMPAVLTDDFFKDDLHESGTYEEEKIVEEEEVADKDVAAPQNEPPEISKLREWGQKNTGIIA
ncbi:uncharacterized protein LOC117179033 [Belonocnema kinseyi]|uniref:uncharacterized protein LOC117179033 n=1 Tax=Belonocnema kinseyi TaxID=2817044 RepID=UPI00143D85C6|nr:uncharacterized protein LOC117179033 [Belonocnema kinseyi]